MLKFLQCFPCTASPEPIVCYLCKEEINSDLWLSGDHRYDDNDDDNDDDDSDIDEGVPADKQSSCPCYPPTLQLIALIARGDSDFGLTRSLQIFPFYE